MNRGKPSSMAANGPASGYGDDGTDAQRDNSEAGGSSDSMVDLLSVAHFDDCPCRDVEYVLCLMIQPHAARIDE